MPGRPNPLRPAKARTLGPVADLERHLPSDWWRTLFNAVYVKTDGDVVENAANTTADVDLLIAATGLRRGDPVLDLCCGQGRHCLELARRGFRHLTGIDRSRYLIQLARRRAGAANLAVSFREGDARSLRATDGPFACVAILGNSFGYFDRQADDLAVLAAVRSALRPDGVLAMDLSDGDWVRKHFERRSWEWIDQQLFVCRERTLSADGTRLVCREVVTDAEKGVIVDQFYAERLYSREQLQALLREAGFIRVHDHGGLKSGSDRNQDLGMMAHRFFVTAHAPKAPRRRAAAVGPVFPEVTVLLGDPRLADAVKRDGKFQAEDLATVRRLREALAELPEYHFRILNNHDTMLADLRRRPPAFVLNLCDEGYRNDPLRELHLPAWLEMLGVPYSGAGPACLGFCYNKSLTAAAAADMDIPIPAETYFGANDLAATIPTTFPAIIKPVCADGSVGITAGSIAQNPGQLVAALERLRDELPQRSFLVQEFLTGPEYTVGVIGNAGSGLDVLPIVEPDYSGLDATLPRILGYESKWLPDSPDWKDIRFVEASLSDDQRRRLHDYSIRLFERLDCRDYARFDFRTGADGVVKLLEVNPNPGWCWDGKLAMMAGLAGWSYTELLRRILEAAQKRLAASIPRVVRKR
jgi:D-alanine-D-alanine ligase